MYKHGTKRDTDKLRVTPSKLSINRGTVIGTVPPVTELITASPDKGVRYPVARHTMAEGAGAFLYGTLFS